jgi:membrane protein
MSTAAKKLQPILREAKRLSSAWSKAKTSTYGAAVAYYTTFSLAPLLVIAVSIAGIVLDRSAVEASIMSQFRGTFGESGALLIQSLINSKTPQGANIAMSAVGFVLVLVGATGIFGALQAALDAIFSSLPEKGEKGIWKTIVQKIASVGMVLSLGFVLIVSLAASAALNAFSGTFGALVPGGMVISEIIEFAVSLILVSAFLGCMFKFLPSKRLAWKPACAAGLIAGIMFTVGKYLLGLYLGSSSAASAYGAASSLVLIILWTYYMAQVLFLSAILSKLYVIKKI